MTSLEMLCELAAYMRWDKDKGIPDLLPFIPLFRNKNDAWTFWCPNLTPEGRCGDYENRPFACRHYQPLQDALCASHTNAITRNAYRPRLTHQGADT